MIIFPHALIGSPPDSIPLSHARIGHHTYTRGLDAAAVTVSSEAEGGPRDMPLYPETHTYWEPTALPATWLLDLGTAQDLSYVGIVGMIGSLGCSVTIETSVDNDTFDEFSEAVSPGDDSPLMFLDNTVTARWVRITIAGSSAVMPRVAVVYAGIALAMQRSINGGHKPITMARRTEVSSVRSRGGQFLGQSIISRGFENDAKFRFLTAAWVRDSFMPFVKDAARYPYFFAWRPLTYGNEVGYVVTEDDIHPVNSEPGLMEVSWSMQGWGYST